MELRHQQADGTWVLVQRFETTTEADTYLASQRAKEGFVEARWSLEPNRPVELLYRGILVDTFVDRVGAETGRQLHHQKLTARSTRPVPPGAEPRLSLWTLREPPIGG